jgi:phage terminase small subunit
MAKLANTRHELFAQALAKGNTLLKAHEMAGFKPRASYASKLAKRPDVSARIAELIDQWSDDLSLSLERVLQELSRVAFSDVRRIVSWTGGRHVPIPTKQDDGSEVIEWIQTQRPLIKLADSAQIDGASAAAIQEITQSKDGSIRVKLHPKIPALQALAQHFSHLDPAEKARQIGQVNPLADPSQPLDFKRLNQEFSLPATPGMPEPVPDIQTRKPDTVPNP